MRYFPMFCLSLCGLSVSCTRDSTSTTESPKMDIPSENENDSLQVPVPGKSAESPALTARRMAMVQMQLERRGLRDPLVLDAMRRVQRHQFVPLELTDQAYHDSPLPIGLGQTISQPYIVGLMTELVRPRPGMRALDVGTGCGYQAAILAEIVGQVYSIEIVSELAAQARQRLTQLGYQNVEVRHGDGYGGWSEQAPFDIIVVAAAPAHIPRPLLDQLAKGGRMVIPVGLDNQDLKLIEKDSQGAIRESIITGVRFVPMTGQAKLAESDSDGK
jgi:protein-L-isoaspartate(D-aspartate) O-methyltransferase